jgi:hypothetical protein
VVLTPGLFDSWKKNMTMMMMMMMMMLWLNFCLCCSSLLVVLIPGGRIKRSKDHGLGCHLRRSVKCTQ